MTDAPLSEVSKSLFAAMQQTNQILVEALFPGRIVQLALAAERRVVQALLEYDDGDRTSLTISAQFFTPYVLAAVAHSSFLLMRIHSITDELLSDVDTDGPCQGDLSEGMYCNMPGFVGWNADPADEQERAKVELQDHLGGGGKVQ